MAWLHAVPKPDERTKRAQIGATPTLSRLDRLKRDKVTPKMPLNPAPHIIERLTEIGFSEAAGMGVAPVSWATIDAWQRLTGTHLPPWEAKLLRKLSVAYVAESRRAESENCPPPWRAEVTEIELEASERRLRMVLG